MRRLTLVAMLATAALTAAACRSMLAPGVTCEGVRALKLGMSKADVARWLGPPLGWAVGEEFGVKRETWEYSDYGLSRPRLFVDFDESGLTRVAAYYMPILGGRSRDVYTLDAEWGHKETPEFEDYVPCQR